MSIGGIEVFNKSQLLNVDGRKIPLVGKYVMSHAILVVGTILCCDGKKLINDW